MSGLPFSAAALPPARGGRSIALLTLAVAAAAGGVAAGPGLVRLGLFAAGATIAMTLLFLALAGALAARDRRRRAAQVRRIVAEDAAPCFTTDAEGAILYRNKAAEARFGGDGPGTLAAALGDIFAHPAAVLYRLQSRARRRGAAREDVVTRRGHLRLSVHRLGEDGFLWRLEEMMDRGLPGGGRGAEGLGLPMLVVSRTGTILFMNEAVRRLVGGRPRTLDRIFTDTAFRPGEPVLVAGAEGPVRALVAEVEGAGERRELYLLPAPPGGPRDAAVAEDDLPVALLRLGQGGAIRAANRRAREMLALSAEVPVSLPELLDGPGRPLAHWLDDIAEGRLPPRPEVMRLRRASEDRYVQVVPWRAPDGALSAVLTDATALKTLEAQFAQGQKMQAIGQLAGGIAHDFNNLLTAISGHCDLLLVSRDATDPDYADLMQIRHNSNRAAALVSQLLGFSRKQPMLPERLELAEVLGDVTHLLRRLVGEKVTLELAPSADPGVVRADRRQIEQVLINLVVNARDAMPEGGPIRISTARRTLFMPLRQGRATVPPGDYALVSVSDKGHGIPPDLQERIFEPFYTTKRAGEGTGLGLATVYGIVKQSGGFIFVESQPGEGSTFTLWLPLHETGPVRGVDATDVSWVVPQIVAHPPRGPSRAGGPAAWPEPNEAGLPAPGVAVGAATESGRAPADPGVARTSPVSVDSEVSCNPEDPADADPLPAPPRDDQPAGAGGSTPGRDERNRGDSHGLAIPMGLSGAPRDQPDYRAARQESGPAVARAAEVVCGVVVPPPVAPGDDAAKGSLRNGRAEERNHILATGVCERAAPRGFGVEDDGRVDVAGSAAGCVSEHDSIGYAEREGPRKQAQASAFAAPGAEPCAGSWSPVAAGAVPPAGAGTEPVVMAAVETSADQPSDDATSALDLGADRATFPHVGYARQDAPEHPRQTATPLDLGIMRSTPVAGPEAMTLPAEAEPLAGSDADLSRWCAEPGSPPKGDDPLRSISDSSRSAASRGAGVVLLVEDEAPVRIFASRALRLRGFTVIEAGCAEDALEALSDPALAVDVFVTDVTMPGMDGPTWVRRALEDRPGVRVVFVSGYAEESLPQGRGAFPDSVFLSKPFSLDELTRTVQRQLH